MCQKILFNVNPSEKSPTFKLWDESHGGLRPKRRQAFSPPGGSHDIHVVEGGHLILFSQEGIRRDNALF